MAPTSPSPAYSSCWPTPRSPCWSDGPVRVSPGCGLPTVRSCWHDSRPCGIANAEMRGYISLDMQLFAYGPGVRDPRLARRTLGQRLRTRPPIRQVDRSLLARQPPADLQGAGTV